MSQRSSNPPKDPPHYALAEATSDILNANKGLITLAELEDMIPKRIPGFHLMNYRPVAASLEDLLRRIKAFTVHTPKGGVPTVSWRRYKSTTPPRKKAPAKTGVRKASKVQ